MKEFVVNVLTENNHDTYMKSSTEIPESHNNTHVSQINK